MKKPVFILLGLLTFNTIVLAAEVNSPAILVEKFETIHAVSTEIISQIDNDNDIEQLNVLIKLFSFCSLCFLATVIYLLFRLIFETLAVWQIKYCKSFNNC